MNLRYHYITLQGKKQSNFVKKGAARFLRPLAACCAVLALCAVFCGCEVQNLSSLRSFSQPYWGEYVCDFAQLGGKDVLSSFRSIVLTLNKDGSFTLTAAPKLGKKIKAEGRCDYEEETGVLIFRGKFRGKECRKDVLVQDGCFVIEHTVAGKTLAMRFRIGSQ